MSLLLDARKKIELALEQTGVNKAVEPQLSETLHPENSPASAAPSNTRPAGSTGAAPPLRSNPVAAGKNLFAAKSAPVRAGRRMGIIPIALISGAVIAAGGGYYVWREISPPPVMQRQIPEPPPAAPIVNAAPPAPSVASPAPAAPATTATAPENLPVKAAGQHATKGTPAPTAHLPPPSLVRGVPQPPPGSHLPAERSLRSSGAPTGIPLAGAKGGATDEEVLSAHPAQTIRFERGQLQANTVDPTLLAAWQAYRNGDLRTAWQRYSDVLKQDAKNRDALLGMAAIAQQQSQDDTAARYYDQVLALDPRDPIAHAGMLSLLGPGNEAGAESRLKLLLTQQSRSAALHFALGNLYAAQSRWSDAQQSYFNASNLEPDNAQFVFNLAVSLDHLEKRKLAAQYYQRALQMDTSDRTGFDRTQTQQRLKQLSTESH